MASEDKPTIKLGVSSSEDNDTQCSVNETSLSTLEGVSIPVLPERGSHGRRLIEGFLEIVRLTIYISGLGASFLFSSIVGELHPPRNMFDTDRVRFLLSVSLLMFLGALGLASFLMLLLIFNAVEVAER